MIKVLTVLGTRPEAFMMAPVVKELSKNTNAIESKMCMMVQHLQMLDQAPRLFDLHPDYGLNMIQTNRSLSQVMANVLTRTHLTWAKRPSGLGRLRREHRTL